MNMPAKKLEVALPACSQLVYIVEFRKGWLSQTVLKTFDNAEEAYAYEEQVRKDERRYLAANPEMILTTSLARR